MKKLLSMLAVSTLVGTSASNLKPLFKSNVSQGFKSNQTNKNISIQGENEKNPFIPVTLSDIKFINSITVANDGTVYVGTDAGLYKSSDGINFKPIGNLTNKKLTSLATTNSGTVYVGTDAGLYKSSDGINFNELKIPYIVEKKVNSVSVVDGNIIYIHIGKEIYKSSNGTDFGLPLFGYIPNTNSCFIKDKNKNCFFGTSQGLWKSTDGTSFNAPKEMIGIDVLSLATTSNGDIFVGTDAGLYKSSDGGKTFQDLKTLTNIDKSIVNSLIANDGTVYVGTDAGLYKSSDGINFKPIGNLTNKKLTSLATTNSGTVYVGTSQNLFSINLIHFLLKINNDGCYADEKKYKYGGVVYNSAQKIDIKDKLVETATLDSKNITLPTTDLDILIGEHTLILTLKDEYKKYANWFGGDNNSGEVTYKLWVKTLIDKKDINYTTNQDDTDLTDLSLGFVSTSGNTANCPIIQTKIKDGSVHNAPLNISYDDALIDYSNSYYVQGTVDTATNDFSPTVSNQTLSPTTVIKTDGTYHVHLVDTVGNTYDSYLELGKDNWKLKGTFNDEELNKLKTELNVEVDLTDPKQLARATGWLKNYEQIVSDLFEKSLKANGKGFDSEIKNELENDFKWFLNPLTYEPNNEPKFDDGIDKDKLDKKIRDTAEKCLQDGLTDLPQNLNIDFKNVTDKQMLDNCKTWINNYEKYIKDNVSKWITDISNVASRGFATSEQTDKIKTYINSLPFNNYLKRVEWTPNLTASGYDDKYLQYVELDKLQSDAINWVNQNIPEINQTYQQYLQTAESGLNLHGYSIEKLLNGKSIPQTKSEIDNFADGQSFHNWLQSQANIKFHGWQLAMGLGIAIPLFLVVAAIAWVIRSRTNPKYNGVARARKNLRQDKKNCKN